jgi:hypothetical protein
MIRASLQLRDFDFRNLGRNLKLASSVKVANLKDG